ncbi:APC family permease [Agromyces sp. SYSU K20354]|uniref:APC family permease n=1 Tax=Agromyces cavernae TaxID=2898659 RepID=UPI001E286D20|nr:APC family permease [Agromyces cavernae]MCD2441783.1 APC family permease [Agromyces cavernae]
MTAAEPHDRLVRRLGLGDAVAIGLAAMIGAGVFAVWAPAAQAAGAGLVVGLAIAAFVALANAASTAQLAVRYPESGGAYRYGRERLGEWPGFLAGWGFVVGKTASCAAMALTAAAYLVPGVWQRPVAVAVVVVLVGVNLLGVTRTARVGAVLVAAVIAVLALVVVAGIAAASGGSSSAELGAMDGQSIVPPFSPGMPGTAYGILQSAALIFFAFAGYARIATLGEEVREPSRTIPRAIGIAFGVVITVYLAVGAAALAALGPRLLAASGAPLVDVVAAAGWSWAEPVVRIAAGVAALGSLLVLIAGIARTELAMARDRELPARLAAVHPRTSTPLVAELVTGAAILVLVLAVDLREAIGFSSFGVLVYYLIANVSAITQPAAERRVPRTLSAAGAIGCAVLVVTLPPVSIGIGLAVFVVGALGRLVVASVRRRRRDAG